MSESRTVTIKNTPKALKKMIVARKSGKPLKTVEIDPARTEIPKSVNASCV
jgi:hypothetical protein